MKKISSVAVNLIKEALEDDSYAVYGLSKSIFDSTLRLGVNWAAIGTVPPAEATQFAGAIVKVSLFLQAINDLELSVTYDKDSYISDSKTYSEEYEHLVELYEKNDVDHFIERVLIYTEG